MTNEKAFEPALPEEGKGAPSGRFAQAEVEGQDETPAGEEPVAEVAGEVQTDQAEPVREAEGEPAPEEEKPKLVFPLSYPVPLQVLREKMPFLMDHGLNVEVNLSDTTFNGEISIRELERLAIELRRNKIKVSAHLPHRDLKLASHDKMIKQHSLDAIQEGLEIGKILGARVAIFHSGFSNHVKPDEIDWWVDECIETLEELVARAREEEVIVALENTWESDEQVIQRLFEAVDSPWLRFCCDLGHAACFSQFAPEEWVYTFREKIANLDFHDNDGMQDQHLACGAGVVGYEEVAEPIHEALSEPVNVTLDVSEEDLMPSIEHLEACGFVFERSSG